MWSPPQAAGARTQITHLALVSWVAIIVALVGNVGIKVAVVSTVRVGIKSLLLEVCSRVEAYKSCALWA